MEERIKCCPFCGCRPKIKPDKKTHCQLHGEPSQEMIVYCDWDGCVAKPMVKAGNVYNGIGDAIYKKEATEEAIKAWNTRHPQQPSEPLKELDEQKVVTVLLKAEADEEARIEFFKKNDYKLSMQVIKSNVGYLANAICSKFGQPSEKKSKAEAIYEAIRNAEVGSDIIIHNEDMSVWCILNLSTKEHPERK